MDNAGDRSGEAPHKSGHLLSEHGQQQETSKNLLCVAVAVLRSACNPHIYTEVGVPVESLLLFLCSIRLVLVTLATIFRDFQQCAYCFSFKTNDGFWDCRPLTLAIHRYMRENIALIRASLTLRTVQC